MSPLELLLADALLARAGEELSNRGCTDFEIPNTREAVALLNAVEQWNVGPGKTPETMHLYDPDKKSLFIHDWYLLAYLRHRLASEESRAHQAEQLLAQQRRLMLDNVDGHGGSTLIATTLLSKIEKERDVACKENADLRSALAAVCATSSEVPFGAILIGRELLKMSADPHTITGVNDHDTAIWNAALNAVRNSYAAAVSSRICVIDETIDRLRR